MQLCCPSCERSEPFMRRRRSSCERSEPFMQPSAALHAPSDAKVSLQQTLECFAVAGFVAGHFVYGVMNGVEIEFLG